MSTLEQPWKVWFEREKEDASSSDSEDGPVKPWLAWQPTPQDPSVKPWLSWNANMDNGDVHTGQPKRIITHVMSGCSRWVDTWSGCSAGNKS
ncbi:hypothetical protein CPLU01_03557 [Colletotrichum plurivorum]|uniref:Uncharacterized protein n=1 Tax=Colletotrichum plurivorum TaxID=2175906 RepID=A0A8H6NL33_9PEZI|nr:hypothetical protein CPLU01_03557 [Colletotrichum plurivorum]